MNNWNFTGNIGRDCETRFIPSGDAVVSFSVGVTSGYGEKQVTTWANCSMFGKRGQAVAQYLTKGAQVGITGEVTLRKYTTKEGNEKSSLDVRVADLTLLGGKREESSQAPAPRKPQEPQGSGFDDIPFN